MSIVNSSKSKLHRQRVILIISILVLLCIEIKFFDITVFQHIELENNSQANSLRKIYHNAPRGLIYDRNGIPIVDNKPTYDLKVTPFDVTKNFNYKLLSRLINIHQDSLKNIIIRGKKDFKVFNPLLLNRHISFESKSMIQEYKLDFPGLFFSEFPARTYPGDIKLTHILGYLREVNDNMLNKSFCNSKYKLGDIHGFTGIEKIYECDLKGIDGLEYHLYDVKGLDHGVYDFKEDYPTINGEDLLLTIDSRLQQHAETLIKNKKGAIVAMDPVSGEILAMVSSPDYDLKSFTGPIPSNLWDNWNLDLNKPLINRAIQGLYPPGSVLKLVIAAYALDNNIISKDWTVDCKGSYHYYDHTYSCWNKSGHGPINLIESIRYSCNIYYYELINKIKFNDWFSISESFGFNKITNIDLPSEKSGIIPNKKYMDNRYGKFGWARGYLLNFVIGQGDVLATPLQVLQMINLIATNGETFEPHLKLGKNTNRVSLNLKKSTWNIINKSMWEVVNHPNGTGKRIKNDEIWGKTGTSQNPHGEDHSWFSGYTKLDNNKMMSLTVIIENGGKGSGSGTIIAGELFNHYKEINKLDEKNN